MAACQHANNREVGAPRVGNSKQLKTQVSALLVCAIYSWYLNCITWYPRTPVLFCAGTGVYATEACIRQSQLTGIQQYQVVIHSLWPFLNRKKETFNFNFRVLAGTEIWKDRRVHLSLCWPARLFLGYIRTTSLRIPGTRIVLIRGSAGAWALFFTHPPEDKKYGVRSNDKKIDVYTAAAYLCTSIYRLLLYRHTSQEPTAANCGQRGYNRITGNITQ